LGYGAYFDVAGFMACLWIVPGNEERPGAARSEVLDE
jgi:hypothetical protein